MTALPWHSLKLRLPLLTVLLFLGGLWTLALFAHYKLRQDMRSQVEAQQQSTAMFAALALEHTLQERQAILLRVARSLSFTVEHQPELLASAHTDFMALHRLPQEALTLNTAAAPSQQAHALQASRLGLVVLQQLFNGGTFVTNRAGIAIASFPPHIPREGLDYADMDYIQHALAGRISVSQPYAGRSIDAPVVVMAVPIWGEAGHPIGALAGVLDLSHPNFLDSVQQQPYGRSGGFLVVDQRSRTIVAASDRQRIMERLPMTDADTAHDVLTAATQPQQTQFEHLRNGQPWLVAVRNIPTADWAIVVSMPLAEALAPIRQLTRSILWAATLVSLLAALGVWRLLHRELQPLAHTTQALATMTQPGQHLRRLPVPQQTEVAQMTQVFNHLVREIEQRQQALRESERLYRTAFMLSPDALEIVRVHDGSIVDVNEGFEQLYGWSRAEALGHTEVELGLWERTDDWEPQMQRILLEHMSRDVELQLRHRNGNVLTVLRSGSLLVLDGEHCILWISHDVTAFRQAHAQIERLTSTDSLTGLPNRETFVGQLEHLQARCLHTHTLGALLYLDLDDFQSINDTLGHACGDLFLTAVAERIRTALPAQAVLARPSGDEFLILLPDLPPVLGDAARITGRAANQLQAALDQAITVHQHELHGSASIGILLFGQQHEAPMELLRKVDLTLNLAKNAGPGSVLFYEAQMQMQVSSRARLQRSLREALRHKQGLELHYQPQIDDSGTVVGVEALVRWRLQEQGMVSPAEFIPLAEKTGLILPLGHWILHTACSQMAAWAQQPGRQHIAMAVNVSAGQFQQDDFVQQVQDVLRETGAPAHLLKLELTESVMVQHIDEVVQRMQHLRTLGVRFSIDDFGTGFSSLAYLKRLPLDQLKIDQGFVRDCLDDHNDASIAKTVIALGHSLGLEVIAEGVESADHQAALRGWGCRFFQGYGISKPLPIEALERFLQEHTVV